MRVPFTAAHAAGRAALAAALNDPELTPRQLRVLAAVISHTVLWSQLDDRRSLSQLAATAGITGTDQRKVEKRVADDLRHLAKRGIVTYEAGGGRRRLSTVGIPPAENGPDTGAGNEPEKGPRTGPKRAPAPGPKPAPAPGPYARKAPQGAQSQGPRRGRGAHPTAPRRREGEHLRHLPPGVVNDDD